MNETVCSCQCPSGYDGPRCQQTTRTFRGNGWAWYPALEMCDSSHFSVEFLTKKPDGTLLYNGPMVPPELEETLITGTWTLNFFFFFFFFFFLIIIIEMGAGLSGRLMRSLH